MTDADRRASGFAGLEVDLDPPVGRHPRLSRDGDDGLVHRDRGEDVVGVTGDTVAATTAIESRGAVTGPVHSKVYPP